MCESDSRRIAGEREGPIDAKHRWEGRVRWRDSMRAAAHSAAATALVFSTRAAQNLNSGILP